tara:strand:- start:3392 stop:6769 length:3378 start_codon:yes stop_codon:yes gene_type:complete
MKTLFVIFFAFIATSECFAYSKSKIKKTLTYQQFEKNYEINLNFIFKTEGLSKKEKYYDYTRLFLSNNLSDDLNKNFIIYTIASELLLNSNVDFKKTDIKFQYISDYYDLLENENIEVQCKTSFIYSRVFSNFGFFGYEFKINGDYIKNCKKLLSNYEYGFVLLQLIHARSQSGMPPNENYKKIGLELLSLDPYVKKNLRPYPENSIDELNWEKLFVFKGYGVLIAYYQDHKKFDQWSETISKTKLIKNISKKNPTLNSTFLAEIRYFEFNYKKSTTNSLEKKIEFFKSFEKDLKFIYKNKTKQMYLSNGFFIDTFIEYAVNLYNYKGDKDLLKKNLKLAEKYALKHINSEYFLSFIESQKKYILDISDFDSTKGIVNKKGSLMIGTDEPGLVQYEKFSQEVQHEYDNNQHERVISLIDAYENQNGLLSYPQKPLLIYLKYASFDILERYEEAINYRFLVVKNFSDKYYFSSGLNYLTNSQLEINKDFLERSADDIIRSLFQYQYSGYDNTKQGKEAYSNSYNLFLPTALDMLLYIAQISDLNEANHSAKFLRIKNFLNTSFDLLENKKELKQTTINKIKDVFFAEKKFIQYSMDKPDDLEQLTVMKKNIEIAKNNLNKSKEMIRLKKDYPDATLNKLPLNLIQIIGKLNLDEQIIYVKEFKHNIITIKLNHMGFDWGHIKRDQINNFNKDIQNYKDLISNPNSSINEVLSKKIFMNLLSSTVGVPEMDNITKIYFINSSSLIDLPLETLIFIDEDKKNGFPPSYLIDYFSFVYLPSIDFFQEVTNNKTIIGTRGYTLDSYFKEKKFVGYEFTWIEENKSAKLLNQLELGDIITKVNDQEINYFLLIAFMNSNQSCLRGFDNWCKIKITYLRNEAEFELHLNNPKEVNYTNDFIGFGNPVFNENAKDKNIKTAMKTLRYSDSFEVTNLDDFYKLLPELPETEIEILYPTQVFDKTKVYLREEASEENFQSLNGQSIRILSIASHAVSIGENSIFEEPSIILSKSNSNKNDGILRSNEILDLSFNNDLVILSACNTFSSSSSSAHKISGLANSFLIAGSHNLILSRWPVDSDVTTNLMMNFYKYIKHVNEKNISNDYVRALRWAMLEQKKINPHPFFWAPFFVIGE